MALVMLLRNPWSQTIADSHLESMLKVASNEAENQLAAWREAGSIEDGRDSFAAVLFDPTRPAWATNPEDMTFAVILFGPNGPRYVPNAAAKAWAHYRHNTDMGTIVKSMNHLLGDGEFAYGESAEFQNAIGGGSGYAPWQDGVLVYDILKSYVPKVIELRDAFIAVRRDEKGSHRWYNDEDEPAPEFARLQQTVLAEIARNRLQLV